MFGNGLASFKNKKCNYLKIRELHFKSADNRTRTYTPKHSICHFSVPPKNTTKTNKSLNKFNA